MRILFLDESGDHQLSKIDPSYPVFVLGGVIVDEDYVATTMTERVREFKRTFFGRDDLVLRTADITRNKNGFECLKDATCRQAFYSGLNELMSGLDYQVVACVIMKERHRQRYGRSAMDPYVFSLHVLVERFFYDLRPSKNQGIIIAEGRGDFLNRQLKRVWEMLQASGTGYVNGSQIRRSIVDLRVANKSERLVGLEIADLVVNPIGRYVLRKGHQKDFEIIESKFRRGSNGNYEGFGLVILPRESG